jgi:hypothetical protein
VDTDPTISYRRAQRHHDPARHGGMFRRSIRFDVDNELDAEGNAMNESGQGVEQGDVIEFTLRGERRTAEAMLVTDDGVVLLDLFDGDRPAWARVALLEDVIVYRPDEAEALVAA